MPYKCTACGKFYREGSGELREVMRGGGCDCGKKFLMYVRGVREEDIPLEVIREWEKRAQDAANEPEIIDIPDGGEKEVDLSFLQKEFVRARDTGKPILLGIETIRILEEGKYELDVAALMGGKPVIVKTQDGVYFIDVPYAMRKQDRKKTG